MLLKLFKYDFKSVSRIGVPCLIGILAVTFFGCINAFIFSLSIRNSAHNGDVLTTVTAVSSYLGMFGMFFALSLVTSVMSVMIYLRYYRSTVKNEAYLTMTLPVTADQLIISKVLSALVWTLILSAADILAFIAIFAALLGINVPEFSDTVIEVITQLFDPLFYGDNAGQFILLLILYIILILVTSAEVILQVFASINVGASLSKKYKGLASAGCVVGANMLVNSIVSTFSFSIFFARGFSASAINHSAALNLGFMNLFFIIMICIYLGLAAAFYFLCRHYLSQKVNLD